VRSPIDLRWLEPEEAGTAHEVIWPLVLGTGLVLLRFAPGLLLPFGGVCPFKSLTGWPCAGCGGTRAVSAFLRLDLAAAFRWNPLVAIGLVVAIAFTIYAAVALVFGTRRMRLFGLSPAGRVAVVVAVLVNWAWLFVDGR
jgi:hypothetical protein